MATVHEIYDAMQKLAPLELAEHWDNPGLLVDCGGEVHRVLTALDVTPETLEEAARKGCELIVTHHPVIFQPLKALSPADLPFRLVQRGISAICMHTNLDAAEGGVNEVLAGILGMKHWESFANGCGRVGEIEPVPVWQLARQARDALAVGADCLLTGEADHHDALDAKRLGLSIVALSHYATEFPALASVAARLREAFPEVEVLLSTEDRDPYTYL